MKMNKILSKSTLDSFDIDYNALDDVAALVQDIPAYEMEVINKVLKEVATEDSTFMYAVHECNIYIYTTNPNYWLRCSSNETYNYGTKVTRILKDEYGLDYILSIHNTLIPK